MYDIRRNCAHAEQPYSEFVRSDALRQLVDFLYDEITAELRHMHHSQSLAYLKTIDELSISDEALHSEGVTQAHYKVDPESD